MSKTQDIPKHYDPSTTEEKWYNYWEENGYFHSEPDDRESFTVVIPPPNVTGVLHMGHMLNNTIQDVLVRRARMLGKNTCWVPGTDHASIATEAKVVQKLRKEGITKRDLTRDEFLNHAWEWTEQHGGIILKQLRKLGASCDWQRTRFTLEDDLCDMVIDCFIDLYDRGYIYRGLRMVNWDPAAQTALSDEEVIHKEVQSKLYYVKYPVKNSDKFVTIATTRPETILADTAVCVNPDDDRYQNLIGKTVIIPIVNREVKVIADEYVDPEFGTGCLKITPAHDPNDYEIGQMHDLEIIDMLNPDGTLSEDAEHYIGKDRFEVRKLITLDLEKAGLLVKVEEMANKVGYSERTDVVIEPRLSLQWFCKMDELSKPALESVMNDDVQFHPAKFKNSYKHWMENIRDWCISRQLWWGHRIPAWYFGDGEDDYVIAKTKEEALEKAKEKSEKTLTHDDIRQDEDVLDTWFSSWLWPMSVFDPDFIKNKKPNQELEYYYPTQDLVTAPEIMFFWVARMIMAGYAFAGEKPFSNVYYHGIVRDEKRRKMSKSLGNSPDPLDLIDQYGADGTRVGMLFASPAGNDLLFDVALCEQGRNFSNKIWNAFRFLTMNMDENETYTPTTDIDLNNLADKWMLGRIQTTLAEMEDDFSKYRLNEALKKIYSLVWDDFCDWYIEVSKADQYGQSMPKENLERALVFFEILMKMLHPFMPFITEDIWQRIQNRSEDEALTISSWPEIKVEKENTSAVWLFNYLQKIVSSIRNIRAEKNISPKEPLEVFIKTNDPSLINQLIDGKWVIEKLESIKNLQIGNKTIIPNHSVSTLVYQVEIWVSMEGLIDPEKERERIQKEIDRTEGFLKSVEGKLANEQFVENAPDAVVEKERQKKADAESNLEKLRKQLTEFEG